MVEEGEILAQVGVGDDEVVLEENDDVGCTRKLLFWTSRSMCLWSATMDRLIGHSEAAPTPLSSCRVQHFLTDLSLGGDRDRPPPGIPCDGALGHLSEAIAGPDCARDLEKYNMQLHFNIIFQTKICVGMIHLHCQVARPMSTLSWRW